MGMLETLSHDVALASVGKLLCRFKIPVCYHLLCYWRPLLLVHRPEAYSSNTVNTSPWLVIWFFMEMSGFHWESLGGQPWYHGKDVPIPKVV